MIELLLNDPRARRRLSSSDLVRAPIDPSKEQVKVSDEVGGEPARSSMVRSSKACGGSEEEKRVGEESDDDSEGVLYEFPVSLGTLKAVIVIYWRAVTGTSKA